MIYQMTRGREDDRLLSRSSSQCMLKAAPLAERPHLLLEQVRLRQFFAQLLKPCFATCVRHLQTNRARCSRALGFCQMLASGHVSSHAASAGGRDGHKVTHGFRVSCWSSLARPPCNLPGFATGTFAVFFLSRAFSPCFHILLTLSPDTKYRLISSALPHSRLS